MAWHTLGEIKKENREAEERAQRAPPVACPIDGERLRVRGNVRDCPYGNYRIEV